MWTQQNVVWMGVFLKMQSTNTLLLCGRHLRVRETHFLEIVLSHPSAPDREQSKHSVVSAVRSGTPPGALYVLTPWGVSPNQTRGGTGCFCQQLQSTLQGESTHSLTSSSPPSSQSSPPPPPPQPQLLHFQREILHLKRHETTLLLNALLLIRVLSLLLLLLLLLPLPSWAWSEFTWPLVRFSFYMVIFPPTKGHQEELNIMDVLTAHNYTCSPSQSDALFIWSGQECCFCCCWFFLKHDKDDSGADDDDSDDEGLSLQSHQHEHIV